MNREEAKEMAMSRDCSCVKGKDRDSNYRVCIEEVFDYFESILIKIEPFLDRLTEPRYDENETNDYINGSSDCCLAPSPLFFTSILFQNPINRVLHMGFFIMLTVFV